MMWNICEIAHRHVCSILRICVTVCHVDRSFNGRLSGRRRVFSACYLWPRLGPPLMFSRFCWRIKRRRKRKTESVSLRKCPYNHYLTKKAYFQGEACSLPSSPLPLEVEPLNPATGLVERCKLSAAIVDIRPRSRQSRTKRSTWLFCRSTRSTSSTSRRFYDSTRLGRFPIDLRPFWS